MIKLLGDKMAKKDKKVKKEKEEKKVKKQKTYEVKFTKQELVHIRDLFSVVIPPDTKKTLSQQLAELEDRVYVEDRLWDKLARLCEEAKVPVDDESPDYIVVPTAPPPMGIFQLSPDEGEGDEGSAGFLTEPVMYNPPVDADDEEAVEEEETEENEDEDE